jgi:heme exporter protein C
VDVPIVYFSVTWWRSLHQSATLSLNTTISGSMLFTLFVSIAVFIGCFAWLLLHRFRVAWLEDEVETKGLDLAITERRAEALVR